MRYITNGLLVGATVLLMGCFDNSANQEVVVNEPSMQEAVDDFPGCSQIWYEQVESQISTGDGQGHGPDLGSDEWRSVVEFKLGIRDDTDLESLKDDDWCRYIDEQYIQVHD